MKYFFTTWIIPLLLVLILASGCGKNTDMVDSGTYQGVVDNVKGDPTQIFVTTEDNKTLRLYFTDETQVTQGGALVPPNQLQKGQEVRVSVEKVGQRLHVTKAEIQK